MTAHARFKPAREVENARRWSAEDAQETKERDALALSMSLRETEAETQKLARAKAQREKQFAHWDKWRASEAFAEYLLDRGLKLRDWSKGLPRSTEMEQAALGAMMMLQQDAVTAGMRRLHPRHFDYAFGEPLAHAKIFIAITRLEQQRQADKAGVLRSIDFLSVHEELRCMGETEIPAAYLTACIDVCPCAENIDYYISKVIEKSRLRHLMELGELMQAAASTPGADSSRLFSLASNAQAAIHAHGWCDLKKILEESK